MSRRGTILTRLTCMKCAAIWGDEKTRLTCMKSHWFTTEDQEVFEAQHMSMNGAE